MTQFKIPIVCSFESRRAGDVRSLVERHGGRAIIAPSMREVPLTDNVDALQAIRNVIDGQVDLLVLLTGVGTEAMLKLARTGGMERLLLSKMSELPIAVRGPKPAAVLHRLNLKSTIRAEQPNTWREIVSGIDASEIALTDRTVAVQEYGAPSEELRAALQKRGATVLSIQVYRWDLPENVESLRSAIRVVAEGNTDITLFTSAQQIRHVLQVARQIRLQEEFLQHVPRVASIGPVCSEALRDSGLTVWYEADPPKMGALVRGALDQSRHEQHGEMIPDDS